LAATEIHSRSPTHLLPRAEHRHSSASPRVFPPRSDGPDPYPSCLGPSLLLTNQSIPGRLVTECVRNVAIASEINDRPFVFSADVAAAVVNILKTQLTGGGVPQRIHLRKLNTSSLSEIFSLLKEHGCNVSGDGLVQHHNRSNFEVAWDFAQRQVLKRFRPYASFVIVASNKPRIVDLFSRVLKHMDQIISLYPGIPLELVVVYCPTQNALGRFYEGFDAPQSLRRC
jgi:hypothetical protein